MVKKTITKKIIKAKNPPELKRKKVQNKKVKTQVGKKKQGLTETSINIEQKEDYFSKDKVTQRIKDQNEGNEINHMEFDLQNKQDEDAEVFSENEELIKTEQLLSILEDLETEKRKFQEQEQKYRSLFEFNHDAIVILEPPKWIITSANPAAFKLFKIKKKQISQNANPWKYSPKLQANGNTSSSEAKKMIAITLKDGNHFFEWNFVKTDKSQFVANVLLTKVQFGNDKLIQATIIDISKIKKIEKKLKESQERFELASKGTSDGIWDWDLKTNKVFYSDKWKEMVGYKPNEIQNKFSEWLRLMHPQDRKRAKKYVNSYIKKNEKEKFHLEFRFKHKDGHYINILARALMIRDNKNKPRRLVGTHVDLTAIKESEQKLKESEERYNQLFENINAGIAVYEPINQGKEFLFKSFNSSGEIIDKIRRNKVIGEKVTKIFPGVRKAEIFKMFKKAYKTGKPQYNDNLVYQDKKLGKTYREDYVYKLPSGEIVSVYRDITKLKKLEKENKILQEKIKTLKKIKD